MYVCAAVSCEVCSVRKSVIYGNILVEGDAAKFFFLFASSVVVQWAIVYSSVHTSSPAIVLVRSTSTTSTSSGPIETEDQKITVNVVGKKWYVLQSVTPTTWRRNRVHPYGLYHLCTYISPQPRVAHVHTGACSSLELEKCSGMKFEFDHETWRVP